MRLLLPPALALFAASASCAAGTPGPETKIELPKTPVALRLLRIDDGSVLTLGSLRGKVVLVTVITTWDHPALLEVPRLKQLARKYDPKDLAIVAVVLDTNRKMIRIFADTFEIPYYVGTVEDPAEFTSDAGPFGKITLLPTSILIARDGRIAARMDGVWPDRVLEIAVDRLVAGSIGSD